MIERGALEELYPIDDGDPLKAWQSWYKDTSSEWNAIEDIEGELRRVPSHRGRA